MRIMTTAKEWAYEAENDEWSGVYIYFNLTFVRMTKNDSVTKLKLCSLD